MDRLFTKKKMQIATNYKKKNSILLWLSTITTMRDTAFTGKLAEVLIAKVTTKITSILLNI